MCVNIAGRLYRNGAGAFAVSSIVAGKGRGQIVSYIAIVNRKSYSYISWKILENGCSWQRWEKVARLEKIGNSGKKWYEW